MNIEKYTEAILNCRFCFMCRHLSGTGNVTFTEADTPRVRASMIYGITQGTIKLENPDFVRTIYKSDLSGACRRNCVKHFDEIGLNLAARQDIVEAGAAPEEVKAIAKELSGTSAWKVSAKADVLFFQDLYTKEAKTVGAAFEKIMKKAKVAYGIVEGGCIGKGLKILGFAKEAQAAAKKFATFLNKTGAKTLVVANPAAYDALVKDFPAMGIKLNAAVMHTSEYILTLGLKLKKAAEVYYLESDFLRNYNDDLPFPHKILEAAKATVKPFGTNDEESYSCGEGAVILPKLDEALVGKLARYVEERADDAEKDLILVASPYTKLMLTKYTKLQVKTLEEFVASLI